MKAFTCVLILAIFGFAACQFTELQPSEYENDQTILESLNFGASHLMKDAVQRDVLPDGDYEITIVSKVEQRIVENGTEYRFELDIVGPRNTHVEGYVNVINLLDGDREVVNFFYRYYFDLINSETGEAYEDLESGNEEAEFSWENYEFEMGGEEMNFNEEDNEQWVIESNILPIN